jgi:hypothetical protein
MKEKREEVFSDVEDAKGVVLIATLLGGVLAPALTWTMMPQFGGDLWPFIQISVTIIAFIIGMYAGAYIGTLMAFFEFV